MLSEIALVSRVHWFVPMDYFDLGEPYAPECENDSLRQRQDFATLVELSMYSPLRDSVASVF